MIQELTELERKKIVDESIKSLWDKKNIDFLSFLKDKRFIKEETLREFNIGYCPKDSFLFNNQLFFLNERCIMPFYDNYGELICITTRSFVNENFPHWHESFIKSKYVYGLHLAKQHILNSQKVIIVEGQFDTMVLHSYGLKQTVAMIGTSLSAFQIGMLCRYAKEFYLLSDGDEGGKKSINNSMKVYEEYDLKNKGIKFIPVILPDGLDPDDFVKQFGRNELVNLMIKSKEQCNNTFQK